MLKGLISIKASNVEGYCGDVIDNITSSQHRPANRTCEDIFVERYIFVETSEILSTCQFSSILFKQQLYASRILKI